MALTFLLADALVAPHASDGQRTTLASMGLGTYLLGGPVVHAAHGNWGRALGSLGLRSGAPILGAVLGVGLEDCKGSDACGLAGAAVGVTLGMGAAIAIDAAVLAHEEVPEESAVKPVVSTGKNGTWLGLAGTF